MAYDLWILGSSLGAIRKYTLLLPKFGQKEIMKNKRSWWSLKIHDYPNYDPNDADLEHIAEQIRQGNHQGELIQEEEEN